MAETLGSHKSVTPQAGLPATPGRAVATGRGRVDKAKPKQEVVKTWLFDSIGTRKYAVQIKKASNGNPCLKIVEGVPAANGTYHKFDITIWSEDFERLFTTLDEVRAYITEHNIRTPPGHSYDPNGRRRSSRPGSRPASTGTGARTSARRASG